jgi:hypothetical protein
MIFFREGRTISGVVRKFKCQLKKTQSFCSCSRELNRSGKGLIKRPSGQQGVKRARYRGADKSLARPTSRCISFDGENILFDASLVLYI